MEKFIKSYADSETSVPNSNVLETESDEALPMGTLTTNLGIPLIVVCAKVWTRVVVVFAINGSS